MSECMPTLFFFLDTVSKTAVTFLVSLNLIQKQYWDVELELLQRYIKFEPDPLKSVWEYKAKTFCFALTLWLPANIKVGESGIKW